MIPNASKWYEAHQNISLGSHGVDWVCLLRKIPSWLHGTNFCINCSTSPRFAPSFMQLRKDPKCTRTIWNAPKQEFRVQWIGSGALVAKNYNMTSWHELLHQFGPFCTEFRNSAKRSQMHQNCRKHTKIWVWGKMGLIGCIGCENFRRDFVTRTFAPVRPVLHWVL